MKDSPKDPMFCNPKFWERRFKEDNGSYEMAVQKVSDWNEIGEEQRDILNKFVSGKVFDAGCGYGRIVEFLPEAVTDYVGMDITPFFIKEARKRYPNYKFILGDIRNTRFANNVFDWGIAVGISDSIYWPEMEKELKRICKKTLILWCEKPETYKII